MAICKIERGDGSFVDCDVDARTLCYYRYKVTFTPLEWEILSALYLKKGKVVPRADLVSLICGGNKDIPTRTIDVHISAIRKKLAYIKGARIDAVYGSGYRLVILSRF